MNKYTEPHQHNELPPCVPGAAYAPQVVEREPDIEFVTLADLAGMFLTPVE